MERIDLRVDPAWNCRVHARGLSYHEWKAGGCFWCNPGLVPPNARPDKNGKLSGTASKRNRAYDAIRALRQDQRVTPSYRWPENSLLNRAKREQEDTILTVIDDQFDWREPDDG